MLLTSPRNLALVRALAEHRHFGRAAAALGISQPAVSRSLSVLEAEVGGALFDRTTMQPTQIGRIVLRIGDRVLEAYADLEREIALLKGLEVGELTVAMGPYPAAISGQRAISGLSQTYPKLSIDLRIMNWTDAIDATLAGRVDLAFADLQDARSHGELQVREVRRQSMSFVCRAGHPLSGKQELSLADVMGYPWVGPALPARIGSMLVDEDKAFGSYDDGRQRFRARITVETFPAMIDLAMNSDTLAAAIPFQVEHEVRNGTLCILDCPAQFLTLDYGIIVRRGRPPSPATDALIRNILEIETSWPTD